MWPTAAVRISYLVGEQADCLLRGTPTDWLGPASENFAEFVAVRRGVRTRWEVPSIAACQGSIGCRWTGSACRADRGGPAGSATSTAPQPQTPGPGTT
jgi:hypothetical protein